MTSQLSLFPAPPQSFSYLRDYQQAAVDAAISAIAEGLNPVIALPTGCHAAGQGILLYDGNIKRVEDVLPGDLLMGPDSRPRKVLELCRGEEEMVDIIPTHGGDIWRVNQSHILTLIQTATCGITSDKFKYPSHRNGGKIIDISVGEYQLKSKTFKHIHKLFHSETIIFPSDKEDLPLDPYCLGLFLGDGSLHKARCTAITKPDKEVRDALRILANAWGLKYTEHHNGKTSYISQYAPWARKTNPIGFVLEQLGISGIKHDQLFIPHAYKISSVSERLEILAGLIDTDGSQSRSGVYDWLSKSKQLACDMAFLARSVGLSVSPPKMKYVSGYPDPYWRLCISGNTDKIPCKIPRKIALPRKQKKDALRSGFSLIPTDAKEAFYGFTLSGDGRYLLDDFTVTHNSGKTRCIAALSQSIPGRILIATHRKELLEQNASELAILMDGEHGIYSAGLGRRETDARIIFGGIQSIYSRMDELQAAGPFDTIIVDEAHLVGGRDAEGIMYPKVFAACPEARRIGLSATPYRLDGGPIWGNNGQYFDTLACDVSIRSLTPQYLAPLRGILTAHDIDLTGVRIAAGEYVLSDMSQVACADDVVDGALNELCRLAAKREHWLVFCIDVIHTRLVTEKLQKRGIDAGMIVGSTPADERAETLLQFKAGRIRALVNCLVGTTGFNIPSIDVVVMMRSTLSKSLVVQCIGRGSRKAPGKEDCVIIDFSGNIDRHAPLDGILVDCEPSIERQAKDEAEEKKRSIYAKRREISHDRKASLSDPFGEGERSSQNVLGLTYELEQSKKYPGKQNIVATYRLSGNPRWARAWICLEYPGGAHWHAEQFFRRRGEPAPKTAQEGIAQLRRLRPPVSIVIDRSEKYPRVVVEQFEIKD